VVSLEERNMTTKKKSTKKVPVLSEKKDSQGLTVTDRKELRKELKRDGLSHLINVLGL